jgi:hypothetical protein
MGDPFVEDDRFVARGERAGLAQPQNQDVRGGTVFDEMIGIVGVIDTILNNTLMLSAPGPKGSFTAKLWEGLGDVFFGLKPKDVVLCASKLLKRYDGEDSKPTVEGVAFLVIYLGNLEVVKSEATRFERMFQQVDRNIDAFVRYSIHDL